MRHGQTEKLLFALFFSLSVGGFVGASAYYFAGQSTLASVPGSVVASVRLPVSVTINLDKKIAKVYQAEKHLYSINIVGFAPNGTLYAAVPGTYSVGVKEESHISPFSSCAYEKTIQVWKNVFIHGAVSENEKCKTTKKNKPPISIQVSSKDLVKLYSLVSPGDKVVVSRSKDTSSFVALSDKAASPLKPPKISSYAYYIADLDTGEVLFAKNENKQLPIASISKLFSASVALSEMDPSEVVSVSKKAVATPGEQGHLRVGEKLTIGDLMFPMLLVSSNDAAEMLAEKYGRDKFVTAMNSFARLTGLASTTFADPTGLSEKNKSTAKDLFLLARSMYKSNSKILTITKSKDYSNGKRTWLGSNHLVTRGESSYLGGKTGFISAAGLTSVALFSLPMGEFEHRNICVVLLRSVDRDRDHANVLAYANPKISYSYATPEISKKDTRLLFLGDIMLSRAVAKKVSALGGDYGSVFALAPAIKRADIAFGNLEGPVSERGYDLGNKYSFRAKPEALAAAADAGFDVLSLANNHMGDWGRSAFEDTVNYAREYGIEPAGAGLDYEDASALRVIEKNGIKFGFLAFSDVGPEWLVLPRELPVMMSAKDPNLVSKIASGAAQVDYLVVSFHFGDEYEKGANVRQQELAHRSIEAGAKIVVGHHPHVTGTIEKYKGGVIAYSLGNAVFDQNFSVDTMTGGALSVTVDKMGIKESEFYKYPINESYQPVLD